MKIKNEKIWFTQITSTKTYIITSTNLRDMYYLYEVIDGKPHFDGSVSEETINPEFECDEDILESHRAFKTKKIAKLFSDKTQVIADQLYFKELYDADFVPDWSDGCGLKFYLVHNNSSYPKAYFVDSCYCCAGGETVYFSSYEIAKKCADWLNSRITKQKN